VEEEDHLDGRARFALGCAALSLLALVDFGLGFFFALLGAIFAGASVIAVDEPAGPRTRRFALVAGLICAIVLALTLVLILRAPQSGE